MKLIIEIPDYRYRTIKKIDVTKKPYTINERSAITAIKNGTPLPKGHGKLIVEPTEEDIAKTIGGQNDFAECIRDSVKAVFDNADAIIEADKAESEVEDGKA